MNTKIDLPALLAWARGLDEESKKVLADWITHRIDQYSIQGAIDATAATIMNGQEVPGFAPVLAGGHPNKPETWDGLDHEVLVSVLNEVNDESQGA